MRRPPVAAAAVLVVAAAATVFLLMRPDPLEPRIAAAYVQAQAQALCIVQSEAYRTQAAQENAYRSAQASSTLTPKELARAREAAQDDAELRRRVTARVAALCG